MARKATRKTRTTSKKKVSLKKRASTRTVAAKKRVVIKRDTAQKRAPAREKTAARRGVAAEKTSAALELEKLLDDTQAKLVATWEKEANAALKTFEALRKKLERATEKQRKLKDRRVAAANRRKARRNETTLAGLEKAKQAYTAATEVLVELRSQVDAARTRMKAAKLGLAHAVARNKALARFWVVVRFTTRLLAATFRVLARFFSDTFFLLVARVLAVAFLAMLPSGSVGIVPIGPA